METAKSQMLFPTQSDAATDALFTWAEVKALLDKEHTRRAEYVTRILMALRERFGDEVLVVARQTIYRLGYEKGQARAAQTTRQGGEKDLASLANLIAHKISRLYYGTTTRVEGDALTVRETFCPLPKKWQEMGFSDDEVVQLCLLFDQVDCGMVEGYDPSLAAEVTGCRSLAELGYCQMVVKKKSEKSIP